MNNELRKKIVEENKYIQLLKNNPQFRLQGRGRDGKVVVGIIKGDPKEYKQWRDHLTFKSFDTWRDAYIQLQQ